MSDWYCSSVAWSAVTAWSNGLTATVGMLRRQLATPTVGNERVWRCTTSGTTGGSEPSWTLTKGSTTSDNGVVWTEVTGSSAHQQDNGVTNSWTAPHARVENMVAWMGSSDRGFASSDHTQTTSTAGYTSAATSGMIFASVNRTTGNIPPAAADITAGATIGITTSGQFMSGFMGDWTGFTFSQGASAGGIEIGSVTTSGSLRHRNCTYTLAANSATPDVYLGASNNGAGLKIRLDNPTFSFANAAQSVVFNYGTARAFIYGVSFAGTLPTHAFTAGSGNNAGGVLEISASDFSGFGSSNNLFSLSCLNVITVRMTNCRLSTTAPLGTPVANNGASQVRLELINCDSGSAGYRNEWHSPEGDITTETTFTLSGGATDGIQAVSHKCVSSSIASIVAPLEGPVLGVWNTLTTGSHTAAVQIESTGTLNNDDIWLEIDYLGSSSHPLGTVADDSIATAITSDAAQTSSSATWAGSLGSAVKQQLEVAFSPAMVGMVQGRIKLAKPSTTVYVDPVLAIT